MSSNARWLSSLEAPRVLILCLLAPLTIVPALLRLRAPPELPAPLPLAATRDLPAPNAHAALLAGVPLDPNTATAEDLATIPGIGPALAARIAAHRPYANLEDLERVPGIGPKLRAQIARYARITPRE